MSCISDTNITISIDLNIKKIKSQQYLKLLCVPFSKQSIFKFGALKLIFFWEIKHQKVFYLDDTIMCNTFFFRGCSIKSVICPGATDARYLRQLGIPAVNFSPLPGVPLLIHGHNERLHVDEYKKGIDMMEKVVEAVANV